MGICTDPPCLVTEFCAKGSLANCVRAARSDASVAAQLTWRRRLTMALDAARGLLYLHSRGIVHRWAVQVLHGGQGQASSRLCRNAVRICHPLVARLGDILPCCAGNAETSRAPTCWQTSIGASKCPVRPVLWKTMLAHHLPVSPLPTCTACAFIQPDCNLHLQLQLRLSGSPRYGTPAPSVSRRNHAQTSTCPSTWTKPGPRPWPP